MSGISYLRPLEEGIPEELKQIPQWVCWRAEPDPDGRKDKKVPLNPKDLRRGKVDDPSTWGTFEAARLRLGNPRVSGIGLVLTKGLGITCIDLDACRDPATSALTEEAQAIVDRFATYTEVSPSGTGIHLFVRGTPPGPRSRKGKVEVYCCDRYMTLTGHTDGGNRTIEARQEELDAFYSEVFAGPAKAEGATSKAKSGMEPGTLDDDRLLELARASKNGPKFSALWDGDKSAHGDDHSGADMALAMHLAFWTGKDPVRMDALFRRSGLMRSKWDEPHYADGRTYGEGTIEKAAVDQTETYRGRGRPKLQDLGSSNRKDPYVKPRIIVRGGRMAEAVREAQVALQTHLRGFIYQRQGTLVALYRAGHSKGVGGEEALQRLCQQTIDKDGLVLRLSRAAEFLKKTGEGLQAIDCPERLARSVLANQAEWPFPELRGVATSPFLRQDGSLAQDPGYDVPSAVYLDFAPGAFPRIKAKPSLEQAQSELRVLLDVFKDFPFLGETDKAATVAALATIVVRPGLSSAPLFAIRATKARTGKTLLARGIAYLGTGRSVATIGWPQREEEQDKRILAELIQGSQVVLMDNIDYVLCGASLCVALTSPLYKGRELGKSRNLEVPSLATWFATGNNLQFGGDLCKRVIPIDLDAKEEHPEQRVFDSEFLPRLEALRPKLVASILTILRGYLANGAPDMRLPAFGGFEQWSARVRSALVWAGASDPVGGQARIVDSDPDREEVIGMLRAMRRLFRGEPKTANEMLGLAMAGSPHHQDFQDLLFGEDRKHLSSKSYGRRLAQAVERIEGGLVLRSRKNRDHVTVWWVDEVPEAGDSATIKGATASSQEGG